MYQRSVVSSHAKVNLCIDLGLPVRAVHRIGTRLRYLLHRLFASAQLLNIYPAVEAETYCESPFSLLQEEVCTLQHFTFHTCNWKRDRKEYNRLGCGMYLRVSTAFGVFKRSYHDGS